jgi:hypothetical protein
MNEKQAESLTTMKTTESTPMKQTIISVIGPSCCGKSQYINPIAEKLIDNGYTVSVPHLFEWRLPQMMEKFSSNAQFVFLHIVTDPRKNPNMRIEFHDWRGPMDLLDALHGEGIASPPPPTVNELLTVPMDNDLDEPLGKACSLENPECESCQ